MMTRAIFISSCLLAFCFALKAQNYREDILAVNKTLMSKNSYSLNLHYDLFLDQERSRPFQQRDVCIMRQNANLYVKQNTELEVIDMRNYQVMIDHRHKVMSLAKKDEGSESAYQKMKQQAQTLINTYIDTLVNAFEKIKIVHNDAQTITYECRPKPGHEIAVAWVEIDKRLRLFRSVTTRYREPRTVRELDNKEHQITLKISYSGFDPNPAPQPGLFNEASYLTLKDKKVTGPARKYAHYNYLNDTH